ncbi:pilus assembly protein Flp/PilA [Bacillus mesophilus]|uniref:Flp family type IVb pilin n=1 Tax=Bacillus mesophilus TaxID=1808955 RepID=A0A6M0Q3N4_9BACI|nr:Flp family type IVb pilin [Bacillus mesophilus]MBM7660303.1 pilus assembly protein Flp/PilA [Bacillus mesophilus]NEY71016.1 Flp family type IVb pilin [Bacillus mesophilus]
MKKLKALVTEEQGQGMTEYGLVLGIIAVAVVGFLVTLRGEITAMFQDAVTTVQTRATGDGSGS